ncbi:glutaredoxin family protein [Haliangium sp.]|uniref:glutaredoxin family protein n=1 Tax=Haliangium sp. TaxID=2663208 RepID=UPI003D0FBDB0
MEQPRLSLYHSRTCGYCVRVRIAAQRLGIELELRDARRDHARRTELLEATGRLTVPVLRIDHADGHSEWLPESREIVHWLATWSSAALTSR